MPEDEAIEAQIDNDRLLSSSEYRLDKYDFQERYSKANLEEDASSIAEKLAFKFKFRRARDNADTHARREKRLLERQLVRSANSRVNALLNEYVARTEAGDSTGSGKALKEYHEELRKEAVQSYKDYFESDGEDHTLLANFSPEEVDRLVQVSENYARVLGDGKAFKTIPKRAWNNSLGLFSNFLLEFTEYTHFIAPKAKSFTVEQETSRLRLATKEELLAVGAYPSEIVQKIPAQSQEKIGQ
jgi:hypothetical protein